MKEPLNKLPWELYNNTGFITIESTEPNLDECACQDLYIKDAEYLIQACNNFPKSIELLKECKSFIGMISANREEINYYELLKRLDKFLKKVENE
jgi:hypothetical protein